MPTSGRNPLKVPARPWQRPDGPLPSVDAYNVDASHPAGNNGFLLKDVTAERLFDAVRVVAAGEALLAPAVTRRLIGEFARLRPPAQRPRHWTR